MFLFHSVCATFELLLRFLFVVFYSRGLDVAQDDCRYLQWWGSCIH